MSSTLLKQKAKGGVGSWKVLEDVREEVGQCD